MPECDEGIKVLTAHAVLFDLDGTLIDSSQGIVDAYQFMTEELSLPIPSPQEVHKYIGPSIYEVLRNHFGLTDELVDLGVSVFRRRYRSHGIFQYQKYDGVDELLSSLRDEGFGLSLATSKLEEMAVQIVNDAGWTEFFGEINGSDSDGVRILKRDVIERALERLDSGFSALAMVGDTTSDVVGGISAGLLSIGVAWGFGNAKDLLNSGAIAVATHPRDLWKVITNLRDSAPSS